MGRFAVRAVMCARGRGEGRAIVCAAWGTLGWRSGLSPGVVFVMDG